MGEGGVRVLQSPAELGECFLTSPSGSIIVHLPGAGWAAVTLHLQGDQGAVQPVGG